MEETEGIQLNPFEPVSLYEIKKLFKKVGVPKSVAFRALAITNLKWGHPYDLLKLAEVWDKKE